MSEPADETSIDQFLEPTRPARQGLPPTYRMRHDAHYIDELESRRRPAEASQTTPAALAFPTSIPVTFALQDMSQELEGVASCFNLVAARSRPLRERMGLALARVGVQRNMRAFQALRILLEDAAPEMAPLSLNSAVEAAARSFDEELRVTESRIAFDLCDSPLRLTADGRMIALALQACLGTLVSLVEVSGKGGPIQVSTRTADGLATVELRQDVFRLSADQFSRLADLEWSERPGGTPAGIALAAAARIAQSHGGTLDARRTEAGGCMLIFSVKA